jgi:Family of unknown function (DUF6526)
VAENVSQNFANHARFDPLFHFFMLPVFAISWITSIVMLVRHPTLFAGWGVVFMSAILVAAFKIRLYALKVQDRIIRLEERLRLGSLLPPAAQASIGALTEDQLIGLRFACDAELAALAERCVREKLPRKEVKKAIQTWRADYWRV